MTLLLHLVWADVRRLRWAIAAWATVLLAMGAFQLASPVAAPGPQAKGLVDLTGSVGWFAQILLAATILPLVVHIHPAVGTTAFWMTRPFPRETLAASKLVLLAVLFVGLPALCDALVMTFYRVPAVTQALVMAEATVQRAMLVAIFGALAVLTASLARFALVVAAAIVAAVIALNAWMLWVSTRSETFMEAVLTVSSGANIWAPPGAPDPTEDGTLMLVTVLAGAAVLIVQYTRRSVRRSLLVAGAGVILVASMGLAWPAGDMTRGRAPEWAADGSKARLIVENPTVSFDGDPGWNPDFGWAIGRSRLRLADLPAGWLAVARLRKATFDLENGERIESGGHGFGAALPVTPEGKDGTHQAMSALLDVDVISQMYGETGNSAVVLALKRGQTPEVGASGRYRAEYVVETVRLSMAAVLPLQPDETFQDGAYRLTITGLRDTDVGPHLDVRISDAWPSLDRSPGRSYFYFLRHRGKREAIATTKNYVGGVAYSARFLPIGGVTLTSLLPFAAAADELFFPTQLPRSLRRVEISKEWLDGAELAIVKVEHAGTVLRTLEIPRLQVVRGRQ